MARLVAIELHKGFRGVRECCPSTTLEQQLGSRQFVSLDDLQQKEEGNRETGTQLSMSFAKHAVIAGRAGHSLRSTPINSSSAGKDPARGWISGCRVGCLWLAASSSSLDSGPRQHVDGLPPRFGLLAHADWRLATASRSIDARLGRITHPTFAAPSPPYQGQGTARSNAPTVGALPRPSARVQRVVQRLIGPPQPLSFGRARRLDQLKLKSQPVGDGRLCTLSAPRQCCTSNKWQPQPRRYPTPLPGRERPRHDDFT